MDRSFVRLVGLVCSVSVFAARPARAEDAPQPLKPPRLEYTAPPECPDLAMFRHELALQHADRFDPGSSEVVRVTFTKIRGGYRGTVEYIRASGKPWSPRSQTAASCTELARGVVIDASAALEPQDDTAPATSPAPMPAPAGELPELPEPSDPNREPREAAPPVPPQPQPLPRQRFEPRPWTNSDMDLTVGLSGLAIMTANFTANVGPGAVLAAEIHQDTLGIGFELRALFPSTAVAREVIDPKLESREVTFEVSHYSVSVVPCYRWKVTDRLEHAPRLLFCGVAQVGMIHWENTENNRTKESFAFGPRLGLDVPFAERFAVVGFGEALFNPHPMSATFSLPAPNGDPPANTRWAQPVGSFFFGVGLSVNFH